LDGFPFVVTLLGVTTLVTGLPPCRSRFKWDVLLAQETERGEAQETETERGEARQTVRREARQTERGDGNVTLQPTGKDFLEQGVRADSKMAKQRNSRTGSENRFGRRDEKRN
jgi:hypothetical protein